MPRLLSGSTLRRGGSGEFLDLKGAMPQLPPTETTATGFTLVTDPLLRTSYRSSLGFIEFKTATMYSSLPEGTIRILATGSTFLSLSTTTGNLVVQGGIGVGGNMHIYEDIVVNGLTIGRGYEGINNIVIKGTASPQVDELNDGKASIAIGYDALQGIASSYRNIAIGRFALSSGTDLSNNIAIGDSALKEIGYVSAIPVANISTATKANPVVVTANNHGLNSGTYITITGVVGMTELNGQSYYMKKLSNNTLSLYTDNILSTTVNGTGYGTYISGGTVNRVLSKDNNIAIGHDAGKQLIDGKSNFFIGDGVGKNLTTGSNNFFIGHEVGTNITYGSNIIALGGDNLVNGVDSQINIGSVFYYDGLGDLQLNADTEIGLGSSATVTPPNLITTTSTYTGGLVVIGGVVVTENTILNKNVRIFSTDQSTAFNNGALTIGGGLGVGENANIFNNLSIGGNFSLGTLSEALTRTAYTSTNNSKILVRPAFDINGSGSITSADALRFLEIVTGVLAINSSTVHEVPYVLQHVDNTATGIMILQSNILGYAVNSPSDGSVFLTSGERSTQTIKNYFRIGPGDQDSATARIKADTTLVGTGTDSNSSTTGALVVSGGAGVSGNLFVGDSINVANSIIVNEFVKSPFRIVAPQDLVNKGTGVLSTLTTSIATGNNPYQITIHPLGNFAYVTNFADDSIVRYNIDLSTGILTTGTTIIEAGSSPQGMAIDLTGRFAYVANWGNNSVGQYSINQTTGVLTTITTAIASGNKPYEVVVDPTGRFVYVTNSPANTISQYAINQITGALTTITTAIATGDSPWSMIVDPTGRFAYVSNYSDNTISQYTINQTTGALTTLTTVIATGSGPRRLTSESTGKFVYVVNRNTSTISQYSINQNTGVLTTITNAIGTVNTPIGIVSDPIGRFVYVTSYTENTISQFRINQYTGALSSSTTIGSSGNSESIDIDPTGRFLYVINDSGKQIDQYLVHSFSAGNGNFAGQLTINSPTNATSTTTGALVVTGGVGIGKDLWVGGNIYGPIIGSIAATGNTPYVNTATSGTYYLGLTEFIGTASRIFSTSTFIFDKTQEKLTVSQINVSNTLSSTVTNSNQALVVNGGAFVDKGIYSTVSGNSQENNLVYTPLITISTTTPLNPRVGDFWIDVNYGVQLQYIQDGTDRFWVQFTGI